MERLKRKNMFIKEEIGEAIYSQLFKNCYTKEEIDEVLNKVGIGYLSKQLINSNGEGVSTGERRRIGLARVILNPKPIILLDEPTASLDEISEKIVLEHIKQLANK
jgi:ABC-type transport system involved in cytochrome bd biosynthesis fused ATPase/permease subunit